MKNRYCKLINAVLVVLIGFVLVSCASTTTKKVKVPDVIQIPVQNIESVKPAETPKNNGVVYIELDEKSVNYKFSVAGYPVETELVGSNLINITFPAFVTENDIKIISSEAYKSYEYYLKNSKLSFTKGEATLLLGYDITPQEFESYMPYVSGILDDTVKGYIAKLEEEKNHYVLDFNGVKLDVYRTDSGYVRIDYPSAINVEDIFAFAQYAYDKYESYMRDATVQIQESGSVMVDFGYEISTGDFNKYAPVVENIISSYVATLVEPVKEEKTEAPAPVVKEVKKQDIPTVKKTEEVNTVEKVDSGKKLPSFIGLIVGWFNTAIDWIKGIPVIDWCFANPVIAGAVVLVVVVLIILLCVSGKKKKKNKTK